MPGECSIGPSAATFLELDTSPTPRPALIHLAKEVCWRECAQLSQCELQRDDISRILGRHGVKQTVLAAQEVQPPPANTPEAELPLYEPRFTWKLTETAPESPQQLLTLIRQAFRARQISLAGSILPEDQHLKTVLEPQLLALPEAQGLKPKETDHIIDMAIRSLARYQRAQRSNLPQRRASVPITEANLIHAPGLLELLLEDTHKLQALTIKAHPRTLLWHEPSFVQAVLDKYENHPDITRGVIARIFRENSLDPLPVIEATTQRICQNKQLVNLDPTQKDLLETYSDRGRRAKVTETKQNYRNYRAPEIQKYKRIIASNNQVDPDAELAKLKDRVSQLKRIHDDIEPVVLAHLAYHHPGIVERTIAAFRKTYASLAETYADHFTPKQLERLAYTYLEDAPKAAERQLEARAAILAQCREAGIKVRDGDVRRFVQFWGPETKMTPLSNEELAQKLGQATLSRKIPRWLSGKIIAFYSPEVIKSVADYAALFKERGYLREVYATPDAAEAPKQYDTIGPQGKTLAPSGDLAHYPPAEQEAILFAFGLDKITLGYDVDEEALKTLFKTDDIKQFVDNYLLPYTRLPRPIAKDPQSVLYAIRHWNRSGISGKLAQTTPELEEKIDSIMRILDDQNLPDNGKKAARAFVKRLYWGPYRVCGSSKVVAKAVHAYLNDAERIGALGVPDGQKYQIAMGYSPEFCEYFISQVATLTDAKLLNPYRLLEYNGQGQASAELCCNLEAIQATKPAFIERRVANSRIQKVCYTHRHDINAIKNLIARYDTAKETFSKTSYVTHGTLMYFCFAHETADPVKEIKEWQKVFTQIRIRKRYITKLPLELIKGYTYSKRGDVLTDMLDNFVNQIEEARQHHERNPHPAVDEDIIALWVCSNGGSARWMSDYLTRWHTSTEQTDTSDLPAPVLRRIIAINVHDPLAAIAAFRRLRDEFADDPYIDAGMVNAAYLWSIGRAAQSLRRLRRLLVKTIPRLDSPISGTDLLLRDTIADTAPNPADIVAGSEEAAFLQFKVAKAIQALSLVEKAAVAVLYDLPWLLPAGEQGIYTIEMLCETFNAKTEKELEELISTSLRALREGCPRC